MRFRFKLEDKQINYPPIEDTWKKLIQEHTQLNITFKRTLITIPQYCLQHTYFSEKIWLTFREDKNEFDIEKSDNIFTYLFYSVFYIVIKHSFSLGKLSIAWGNEGEFFEVDPQNMNKIYEFFGIDDPEWAKHSYHLAKDMEGFRAYVD